MEVKIAFSAFSPGNKKISKNVDKNVAETNKRLRNYCHQENVEYIDNKNIKEDSSGVQKLHLNHKSNSFIANYLLKYLNVWLSSDTTGYNSVLKLTKASAKKNTSE